MLELDVYPNHGLWCNQIELVLGMHFSQAVAAIQGMVGVIRNVQVLYSEENPLENKLEINLANDGIKLCFDPINQRLNNIECYDLSKLRLKYSDTLFNCPDVAPNIEQIDHTFGATHPGEYDNIKKVYKLEFRGISFIFPTDCKFVPQNGNKKHGGLCYKPGESPTVSQMNIFSGSSSTESCTPSLPVFKYPTLYQDSVRIIRQNDKVTLGLCIDLQSMKEQSIEGNPCLPVEKSRKIYFGDSVQTVVALVGAPSRIFYKSEDKMRIHAPIAQKRADTLNQKSDYFYNYFTLGIDILFDARTNSIKKFILHTNYPGHYNFNMHHRCQFQLPLHTVAATTNPYLNNMFSKKCHSMANDNSDKEPFIVTAFTKWSDIGSKVKASVKPVVLNRNSSTNTINPFGSTYCYGYQDIIFEVMSNEHLAAITLFDSSLLNDNDKCVNFTFTSVNTRSIFNKEML